MVAHWSTGQFNGKNTCRLLQETPSSNLGSGLHLKPRVRVRIFRRDSHFDDNLLIKETDLYNIIKCGSDAIAACFLSKKAILVQVQASCSIFKGTSSNLSSSAKEHVPCFLGLISQLIESPVCIRKVGGLSPPWSTIFGVQLRSRALVLGTRCRDCETLHSDQYSSIFVYCVPTEHREVTLAESAASNLSRNQLGIKLQTLKQEWLGSSNASLARVHFLSISRLAAMAPALQAGYRRCKSCLVLTDANGSELVSIAGYAQHLHAAEDCSLKEIQRLDDAEYALAA